MIAQVEKQSYVSPEEYLELEINSEERHEYINGEIITVSGGTPNHNTITGNFYAALNFALKRLDHYYKTEPNKWIFSEYEQENHILSLKSIDFEIELLDIYDKVDFVS